MDAIFKTIQFRPEQFNAYLLSDDVGFATCDLIDTPNHEAKGNLIASISMILNEMTVLILLSIGFRRPIYILTKLES